MASSQPDEWVLIDKAAKLAGLSKREFQRKVSRGLVRKNIVKENGSQARALFSVEDILQLKADRESGIYRQPAALSVRTQTPQIAEIISRLDQRIEELNGEKFTREIRAAKSVIASAVEKHAEATKPWLTVSEAAEFSGLPKYYLYQKCRDGSLGINCGTVKHPRFRIKRTDLTEIL